jgi:hypothetical protein
MAQRAYRFERRSTTARTEDVRKLSNVVGSFLIVLVSVACGPGVAFLIWWFEQ